MDERCPVCNFTLVSQITTSNIGENLHVECPRCGSFMLTRTARRRLEGLEAQGNGWKSRLSYWIRQENEKGHVPYINSNLLGSIIDHIQLPNIKEQTNNLIVWLGKTLKKPSDAVSIDPSVVAAVVGCEDGRGVDYIASHLAKIDLLYYDSESELGRPDPYVLKLGLTIKGWEEFENLTRVKDSANIPHHSAFISYTRLDKVFVEQLYDRLKDAGFSPWMDTKNILPGEDWKRAITQAIRTSTFFLACLSKNSVRKRGVIQEKLNEALDIWKQKLHDDIYLIPVRLDECDVPESLKKFQWVDLFSEEGFEKLTQAITAGIKRLEN